MVSQHFCAQYAEKANAKLGIHEVPSYTFKALFKEKGYDRIDFISVDVEGKQFPSNRPLSTKT